MLLLAGASISRVRASKCNCLALRVPCYLQATGSGAVIAVSGAALSTPSSAPKANSTKKASSSEYYDSNCDCDIVSAI